MKNYILLLIFIFILITTLSCNYFIFLSRNQWANNSSHPSSDPSSNPTPTPITSPGDAIGWIGGGFTGWQTTPGSVAANNYQYFSNPRGVFTDISGNIYVADTSNNRISKWDSSGNAIGWIGGASNGWKNGNGAVAADDYQSFNSPCGLYVDSSGNIYVADYLNSRISKWH